jgi:hypothetical protein
MWLSPKVPRDAAFAASVREIGDLYTRPLRADEMVLVRRFADKGALGERLQAFIKEWNEVAHPFEWSTKSVEDHGQVSLIEAPAKGKQPEAA